MLRLSLRFANDRKCAYTSREELAELINQVNDTELSYHPVSVEDYKKERKKELGEFLRTVIAGIYEGIQNGAIEVKSDFEKAAGRPHKNPLEMITLSI